MTYTILHILDAGPKKSKYSIDFKLRLIEEAKKTSSREVGRVYGIDATVVAKWRKNEEKLIQSVAQGAQFHIKGGGLKRDDLLDQILYEWYSHQVASNVKVSGTMLRVKAHELSTACATGSEGSKFSHGWLEGFKKKYDIRIAPHKASNKEHGDANNKLMEKILYDWLVHQQANHVTVSGQMVRAKAEELSKACSPESDYKFTTGWLDGFKKRYNVRLGDKPSESQDPEPQPSTSQSDPLDVKPLALFYPHKF